MGNELSRLATRFLGEPDSVDKACAQIGHPLDAATADSLGSDLPSSMTTSTGTTRSEILFEERASFSPDALTVALQLNRRFAGPETMETRIFGTG